MNNMKRNACQKCVFAVRDDNPHCGLRGFTTSFNVEWCESENDKAPNGYELQEDGYFSWVEKKNKYPKTYEECCDTLSVCSSEHTSLVAAQLDLPMNTFIRLLVARNAYWKIAGEEMGLGKPWELTHKDSVFSISRMHGKIVTECHLGGCCIFEFPTKEMRDAFYENFKEEIEICKELL